MVTKAVIVLFFGALVWWIGREMERSEDRRNEYRWPDGDDDYDSDHYDNTGADRP